MPEYPDISDRSSLVDAILRMRVYGEYTRSLSFDPDTNDYTADKYIQPLSDFVARSSVERAVNAMLDNQFITHDLHGVVTLFSIERIGVTTDDGVTLFYVPEDVSAA